MTRSPNKRALTEAELAQFRKEFREQYGLNGDFPEAFARWGQAGGPERINYVESSALAVRSYVAKHADQESLAFIDAAIGRRPLDSEKRAVQKALTAVFAAIERAMKELAPHLPPRAMRTNPDPAAALLIAGDLLRRVPFVASQKKRGRRSKVLKGKVIEILAKLEFPPAKISRFLFDVGYTDSEGSEDNVNTTVSKLRCKGVEIPASPTAKISPFNPKLPIRSK